MTVRDERSEILFQRYVRGIFPLVLRVVWIGNRVEDEDDLEGIVQRALAEAEENISDLLPEGYYCKIEEA